MASDITVRLQGVEELKRALARVPDKLRRKGLLKALRVSARLVRDDARLAAPVRQKPKPNRRPGTVKRAISIRTSKFARRAGDVGVFVMCGRCAAPDRNASAQPAPTIRTIPTTGGFWSSARAS
jgi:hypothetical protein